VNSTRGGMPTTSPASCVSIPQDVLFVARSKHSTSSRIFFTNLPDDVKVRVGEFVLDPLDAAALVYAVSGMWVLMRNNQKNTIFRDPRFVVGLHLCGGGKLDTLLFRKFAYLSGTEASHFAWLSKLARKHSAGPHKYKIRNHFSKTIFCGQISGTAILLSGEYHNANSILRMEGDNCCYHFSGYGTYAYLRRIVRPEKTVHYSRDSNGQLQRTWMRRSDGKLYEFGSSRNVLSMSLPIDANGKHVQFRYFEGGALSRIDISKGARSISHFFEGEAGSERVVRAESRGRTFFFDGPRKNERVVLVVNVDRSILHCEGEKGAEKIVRQVLKDGIVLAFRVEEQVYLRAACGLLQQRVRFG
jgi:hypothetical protein